MQKIKPKHFATQKMDSPMMNDFMSFISSYNSLLMQMYIPLFAITTYICFRKWRQNYHENVLMNACILSFYTSLFLFFSIPPLVFFYKTIQEPILRLTNMRCWLLHLCWSGFLKAIIMNTPKKQPFFACWDYLGSHFLGNFLLWWHLAC